MAKAKPKKEEETPAESKPAAKKAAKPAAAKAGGAETEAAHKAAAKKAAPAAGAKSKKPEKSAKPAAPSGVPLIDTDLAAQAAAKMVANRDLLSRAQSGEKKESGSFKQLKESLLKQTVQGPGGLLTNPQQQKKLNQGFGGRNQVGHNQTFGADVNRTGVPRRTGG